MIDLTKSIILQVKELVSRNLDITEISYRLHMNVEDVQRAIDTLNSLL